MAIRVYVNGLEEWLEGFSDTLVDRLRDLGLPNAIPVYSEDRAELPERSVILYFGDIGLAPDAVDEESLAAHLAAGRTVIPVLDEVVDAERKLPGCLRKLNSFALGASPDYSRLVSEVLDRLWHLRPSRKVFISYRRVESAGVARQLREALSHRGYDVFLDESSIRSGADFQSSLKVWLNDADFVLLLASPNMDDSSWVMREIEFANLSYVGILALCWPATPLPAPVTALMPDQRHFLEKGDLGPLGAEPAEQELEQAAVDEVLSKVDEYRAKAIHNRLTALLPYFKDAADDKYFEIESGCRFGDLLLKRRSSGKRALIRVLPFPPTVSTVDELYRELATAENDLAAAGFFYAENDVNDPAAAALEWLLLPERPDTERVARRYRLLRYSSAPVNLHELL